MLNTLRDFLDNAKVSPQANGLYQVSFVIFNKKMVCYVNDCRGGSVVDIKTNAYYHIQLLIEGEVAQDDSKSFIRDNENLLEVCEN